MNGDSNLLAGAAVNSCYSLEEVLCVPVVSMGRQEGHISVSWLSQTKLLFSNVNTRWQYLISSQRQKT